MTGNLAYDKNTEKKRRKKNLCGFMAVLSCVFGTFALSLRAFNTADTKLFAEGDELELKQ